MKFHLVAFTFLLISVSLYGQKQVDYGWWNELHDWQRGDPGWRSFMKITPGFLGPNALPVPEVKRGILHPNTELEIAASNHFHPADPTQDISGKLFIPFAKNKIAIEMYGVVLERYAFTESLRDERIARDRDGKGTAVGDFYFSTLIQIFRDRTVPNTLLRMAVKTASGNQLEAARYTDSPGYFFDLSMSETLKINASAAVRPFGLIGFYAWQTNHDIYLQNDALLYAYGLDILYGKFLVSAAFSGYSGYIGQKDRPFQLNFDLLKDFEKQALRLQYLNGLRDWEYKTIRFSFIWKLNPVE
ncbi:MAG: hypothetical protein ACOC11_02015 [Prolixibacteraceae bacterium]